MLLLYIGQNKTHRIIPPLKNFVTLNVFHWFLLNLHKEESDVFAQQ